MTKNSIYPKNFKKILRAIRGRNIYAAEKIIKDELYLYGQRLKKGRKRRKYTHKAMNRT